MISHYHKAQRFRKGVGGQRGLARGNPAHARDSIFFCIFFPIPPLGEAEHNLGEQFLLHLGLCQSPTPSRQPLFETFEKQSLDKVLQHEAELAICRQLNGYHNRNMTVATACALKTLSSLINFTCAKLWASFSH